MLIVHIRRRIPLGRLWIVRLSCSARGRGHGCGRGDGAGWALSVGRVRGFGGSGRLSEWGQVDLSHWGSREHTVTTYVRTLLQHTYSRVLYPLASYPGLPSQLFSQPWKKAWIYTCMAAKKCCEGKAWVQGYNITTTTIHRSTSRRIDHFPSDVTSCYCLFIN